MGIKLKPTKNKIRFRFGDDKQNSLVTILIRILIPGYRFVIEEVDVVHVDVPLLIGLDFFSR